MKLSRLELIQSIEMLEKQNTDLKIDILKLKQKIKELEEKVKKQKNKMTELYRENKKLREGRVNGGA